MTWRKRQNSIFCKRKIIPRDDTAEEVSSLHNMPTSSHHFTWVEKITETSAGQLTAKSSLNLWKIIYSNPVYYRKPCVGGGLGGRDDVSQRNRINGVSPLRYSYRMKCFLPRCWKCFKSSCQVGERMREGGWPQGPPRGHGWWVASCVHLEAPWEWKGDERQKASKASKGQQQNPGPDRGLPVLTQLSLPNWPGKANRNPRHKERNGIWVKPIKVIFIVQDHPPRHL